MFTMALETGDGLTLGTFTGPVPDVGDEVWVDTMKPDPETKDWVRTELRVVSRSWRFCPREAGSYAFAFVIVEKAVP